MRPFAFILIAVLLLTACAISEPRVFTDTLRSVPDVKGRNVDDARGVLESEGFVPIMESTLSGRRLDAASAASECPDATVVEQEPAGGEDVPKASTITLKIAGCP